MKAKLKPWVDALAIPVAVTINVVAYADDGHWYNLAFAALLLTMTLERIIADGLAPRSIVVNVSNKDRL